MNTENLSAIERLNAYHGIGITIYGILFVFVGIVIIQICMNIFNYYFLGRAKKKNAEVGNGKGSFDYVEKMPIPDAKKETVIAEDIPEDDLIAIAAAIELYRRLHFDRLPSRITFTRGMDAQNAWQSGAQFGHRNN